MNDAAHQTELVEASRDIAPSEQAGTPAAPSDAASLMAVISRAAQDPNIDVEKMERLMGMYERIQARQAEQAYTAALNAAQKEIRPVAHNAKNSHTSSTYANLEAISEAADPIIHKHGFSLAFGTDRSDLENHYGVTCKVSHEGGHFELCRADVPTDSAGPRGASNKNPTQAFGSTMTYGRRYLKCMIFDIKTGERDDDGRTAGTDTISTDQALELEALLKEVGADRDKFLAWGGVESLTEIPASQFTSAKRAIESKRGRA